MTLQVKHWVPVGVSLADARRIMEQHGFTCSSQTPDKTDYLICDITESSGFPSKVYSYHHARLALEGGCVSSVQMDTSFKAP
jgi:hypothetical protein